MQIIGDGFTVGEPVIFHHKNPNSFGEAQKETITNQVQPYLEEILSDMEFSRGFETYIDVAVDVALRAKRRLFDMRIEPKYEEILSDYLDCCITWARSFLD